MILNGNIVMQLSRNVKAYFVVRYRCQYALQIPPQIHTWLPVPVYALVYS